MNEHATPDLTSTRIGQELPLRHLQGDEYTYIQNEQELAATVADVSEDVLAKHIKAYENDTITGAMVKVGEGWYDQIWLTTDSAPYHLASLYTRAL
jgi:hypothetical protein